MVSGRSVQRYMTVWHRLTVNDAKRWFYTLLWKECVIFFKKCGFYKARQMVSGRSVQRYMTVWHRLTVNDAKRYFQRKNYFLGFLAPYLDLLWLRFATPAASSVPRTMWYLTPGRSFTLPPRTRTTLCSWRLWPIPGI